MTRIVLNAGKVVIGYAYEGGKEGALVEPFPCVEDGDEVAILGTPDDLRAVAAALESVADLIESELP